MIYFDNGSTTPMDGRVEEEMLPYNNVYFGNPSSLHAAGRYAANAVERAREKVAKSIGARPKEIYFTSGGTESDNVAIQGVAFANRERGNHIITSAIEHHAVLNTCHFLETEGFKVTYLPVNRDGLVSPDSVNNAITPQTILVSIMAANNEIGTIQPIREIGKVAKEGGVLFHTDAVQALGKMPIDVDQDNIDLLAISAHKLHGPKGVGALFIRKNTNIRPLFFGGGQEMGLRSSTENVAGIVGMGAAISFGTQNMVKDIEIMRELRDRIIDRTMSMVSGVFLNGSRSSRLCNNVHFRFDRIEGESLVLSLDKMGIATSTGSACSSRSIEPSHVLKALGASNTDCRGLLRITLNRMNNADEVEYFLNALPKIVSDLRGMY